MPVFNFPSRGEPTDTGGEPPDNGDMLERIKRLEVITEKAGERTASLERELVRVEHSLRAEIHKAINEQTWKLIAWTTSLGAGMVAAVFYIARNVH